MGRTLQALYRAPWRMEVSTLVMRKKCMLEAPKFPAWRSEA